YSGALDAGLNASTLINDAPIVFDDMKLEKAWRPQNYSKKFFGPTRLREGIVHSRNLVSIRVLDRTGIDKGRNHMLKFGFDARDIPRNLSISLGSPDVTPMAMARAFSVFANGGYLIDPYLIQTISNQDGEILFEHNEIALCDNCEGKIAQEKLNETMLDEINTSIEADIVPQNQPESKAPVDELATQSTITYPPRVITAANQFISESFMQDVIKRGTGRRALTLNRQDLAGKTGTANEQKDAWFNGYQRNIVTHTWVGFDTPENLGRGETGGRAALPIWIDFMQVALENQPEFKRPIPAGIIVAEINRKTGKLAASNTTDAIMEYFLVGHLPAEESNETQATELDNDVADDLF
ncbi:Multimodular transpeptidase-transglycosylase, partial [hydrothermal vent metagenome]